MRQIGLTGSPLTPRPVQELYIDAFDSIDWPAQRSHIASVDLYSPHPRLLEVVFAAAGVYERVHSTWLRKRALDYVYEMIRMEDENTSFQCQVGGASTAEAGGTLTSRTYRLRSTRH